MIRTIASRLFMGQATKPCLYFSLHSEQVWAGPASLSINQRKLSKSWVVEVSGT